MRLKTVVVVFLVSIGGWASWSAYTYFFDAAPPELILMGIDVDGHYCGDVQCMVSSDKAGEMSVWLDDNPLITKFKLSKNDAENPFVIPTKPINNGKHQLKIECVDGSFNQNKTVIERQFHVDNVALQAAFVKSDADNKVLQGRTLHVQFQVNKSVETAMVHALADTYECFPESKGSLVYECFIPIACEEKPNEYLLSVDVADKVGSTARLDSKFQIVMYPFKRQTVQISKEKLAEEAELGANEHKLEEIVAELTKNSPKEKLWRGAFCTPLDILRVTTEFGTVRTTQHKGRYAHKALDVINVPKCVVWSTQDGTVVLKDRFESSGNTVIVDHGMGILSLFFHLDEFAKIEVGQKIAKGNKVGTMGKTGHARGYHLHWEMRVNNVHVDPIQWTKPTF